MEPLVEVILFDTATGIYQQLLDCNHSKAHKGTRGGGGGAGLHPCHHGGARNTLLNHKGARAACGGAHDIRRNHEGARNAHVHHAQRWSNWASRMWQHGEPGGGRPGQ